MGTRSTWLAIVFSLITLPAQAAVLMSPVKDADLQYDGILLDGTYDSTITHPDELLGFKVGTRVATPAQIHAAVMHWAEQSERLHVVEYARSHEDRPLIAAFVGRPDNLARLDEIKANLGKLADPRSTTDREASEIIEELPAVAWMAYSIHGNETSGADAAMAAIYHLIASQDKSVTDLIDDMVVIIDPMMNPDGRARFAKSLEQYRGTAPNVDDQSLLHIGDWPYGRTNHYFFDLNRDFFYLTQPETVGRVELINQWRPQLMIDGHEMGPQDTYLMGPPRQPLNDNIDPNLQKWAKTFAREQSAAFDQRGWRYYTGEWFENWYPGYSNYAEYRGSMHILYEQSRMAEDGVRRPEGTVQTYLESVHHQFVSTFANLQTLAKHSQAMYQDFWLGRKNNVSSKGKFANRSYVILANDNHGRTQALVDRLLAQDIDVYTAEADFDVDEATNHLGSTLEDVIIPAGSIVVPNRQPEAPLIAAILEFDAGVKDAVLLEERQKTLRDGSSIMYDTTAWNLTMMYGLKSLTVPEHLTRNLKPYKKPVVTSTPQTDAVAWMVDGGDDRSVAFAARMMERGAAVRFIDKPSEFAGKAFNRGSVMVTVTDNPHNDKLAQLASTTASELDIALVATNSGFGEGELPDWGGEHFRLLEKPQLGIISHGDFSSYDTGATWWGVDASLGIRHSKLDSNALAYTDLRRYNVLVLPSGRWEPDKATREALTQWVENGGTLIAHGNTAGQLASKDGIGNVRALQNSFDSAVDYNIALQREWLATSESLNTDKVMSHTLNTQFSFPWEDTLKPLKEDELKRRDKWLSMFMPSGAMVSGRTDQQHWLTAGTPAELPLLYTDQPLLMSGSDSQAVIRAGVYQPARGGNKRVNRDEGSSDGGNKKQANWWFTLPEDQALHVRMSGLIWPEASQRIANTAYLTREQIGNGQVILFSGQPNFRGSARGTNRLLLNAIVYGPGLGAEPRIAL
ncbi:M14 family metallopeptidase [Alteromonas halophila]|uniref:Peptidase M14 n=1 Tax=Alteromonas halophila TaxID=516698 RepID=A0A918N1T1_9ALTE|nr:M14 family metallopeptidase [Alteromonas halophila]GGW95198.1 peptidase M14 [Alteromonas halophila]